MALAGAAFLLVMGVVYLRFTGHNRAAGVTAQIITNELGEALRFSVPDATAGSVIRFGGQEQPVASGTAMFPLASDSLRVGDNIVLADVVAPNGDSASVRIVLAVSYRLLVDTSALRDGRSSIDVKMSALPGTLIMLEGEMVTLNASGQATKTFPIDVTRAGKGGVIDHVIHYRVQAPQAEAVIDELHTRIPVALMQIDRPGTDLITDNESVEIIGAVGRDTSVSVDGKQVTVKDGRFAYRLPLSKPGEFKPRITASAPGKAPLHLTLKVTRVRDLEQAAREFDVDKTLNYAKISPNPAAVRGRPVAIEGRVYAVDTRAGSSVIQMLARPCPSGQRCSLWVVDPQAGEVSVDRWVRVLGVVDGEQQFRSEKNEVVTVPKIVARYILPAKS
jgi:hypothetical protein